MKPRIALVTVGKSPRHDVVSDIPTELRERLQFIHWGAVDDIEPGQFGEIAPKDDSDILMAKIGEAGDVAVSKRQVTEFVEDYIGRMQTDMDCFVILCTVLFVNQKSTTPVIQIGDLLLDAGRRAQNAAEAIGVIMPTDDFRRQNLELWSPYAYEVITATAHPYRGDEGDIAKEVETAARELGAKNVSQIVMSCQGYTEKLRQIAHAAANRPVLAPTQVLSEYLAERFGG